MKGFGLDGKLFRGLSKAGDFLILALITVICCIPVITIGASLTAAFYSGMRLVKDEENYVYKDFFKSFKTNFVQGFIMEVVLAVIGVVLFIDLRACAYWAFSGSGSMIGNIFMYAIVGCFVVWGGVVLYSFAVLARYDDKAFTVLKNSIILCTHHLPQTIIMMVATYGLMFFSFKYFTAYIVTIPLFIYIDSYIFTRIFKSLENTNDQRAREEQEAAAEKLDEENKSEEVAGIEADTKPAAVTGTEVEKVAAQETVTGAEVEKMSGQEVATASENEIETK